MLKLFRTAFLFILFVLLPMWVLSCSAPEGKTLSVETPTTPTTPTTPSTPQSTLVTTAWADDFNNTSCTETSPCKPDSSNWGYDMGDGSSVGIPGWGNNEAQYYTDNIKNAYVSAGTLKVKVLKEPIGGKSYTSARLISLNKKHFLYGKFEVRAKLPAGQGTWPALWLLPVPTTTGTRANIYGPWPASGEIDSMEQDSVKNNVKTTVHFANKFGGAGPTSNYTVATATSAFHVYRLDWTKTAITGYVDDVQNFTYKNPNTSYKDWPFDQNFYYIINLAMGGTLGGSINDADLAKDVMEIDYIHYTPLP